MTDEILVFGDSILDAYIYTACTRISPEAPVPVLEYISKEYRLGGAANVALGMRALGANPSLMSLVGDDETADKLFQLLDAENIHSNNYVVRGYPTSYKERIIAQGQQIARIDKEKKYLTEHSKAIVEDALKIINDRNSAITSIIISDYNKGSCYNLPELISDAKKKNIATFVDPKTKELLRYKNCFLIKPNLKEFSDFFDGVEIDPANDDQMTVLAAKVLDEGNIDNIIITLGALGCFAMQQGKPPRRLKPQAREVFDVSGAGDTFLACLTLEIGKGKGIYEAAEIANYASGIVVGKFGTSTVTADELDLALLEAKQLSITTINAINLQQFAGKKIVFTNGCFDVLHVGHLHVLNEAKKLGDVLVVGINSDSSVRSLKGAKRPINSLDERIQLLESLAPVDFVCPFHEVTPENLIKEIKPDVLVKGGDYNFDTIVGAEFVASNGGLVKVIDLIEGKSSSNIIEGLSL